MSTALVCIAKNEAKFITEWIAHQIGLGFDHVFVFDNESTDGTLEILQAIARKFPVTVIPWPSEAGASPQISAYEHAAKSLLAPHEWVAFFDCDEFLVLHEDESVGAFLAGFDDAVGAVGINWLTFGSAGLGSEPYGMVTETFTCGGVRHWGNNKHIKTIARVACLERMGIHDARLKSGAYVHADGTPLVMPEKRGIAAVANHRVAQLNHYQCKSRLDFDEKMARGRAGRRPEDPERFRPDPDEFFLRLDRNEQSYDEILKYSDRNRALKEAMERG